EAGIDTGDLVVIERTDQAKEGDIVVALVGNENTLKRLLFDRVTGKVILHPENKSLSDIVVDGCVIQGVARSVIKTLGR
ncbi:MAG: repressor LexA, partial [Oscillospiraceae bacterium]|nr:repressor LexA [Oscillospiraceae bacterium]